MKKSILVLVIIVCTITISFAQETLQIDVIKSEIKWIGEYTFYFGGHKGTIDFKEGYFIKTDDVITGGEFIIDMNSIICTDNGKIDKDSGLVKHLKDHDFFDVNNYNTSKIVITKVDYHDANSMRIEANMTIKGKTLPINFQAEADFETKTMTTKFKIDRRRWDIYYTSKMRDGAISDAIGFEVKLSL